MFQQNPLSQERRVNQAQKRGINTVKGRTRTMEMNEPTGIRKTESREFGSLKGHF
jgi:hypothetical protein